MFGVLNIVNGDSSKEVKFSVSGITTPRIINLRDANGTLAYLSDITGGTGGGGTGATLNAPTYRDQDRNPAASAGDGSTTSLTITSSPKGFLVILVNGVKVSLGNGVKTSYCYFSSDGGTTARTHANIVSGDTLYWNGVVAGYDLESTDIIDFYYV